MSAGGAERRAAAAQVLVDDPGHPELSGPDAHHLERVLRLRPGELVVAADGRGAWTRCRYLGGRRLEPEAAVHHEPAPERPVTVAFAPVKGERAEWVVQKLTELGVDRVVVLDSGHVIADGSFGQVVADPAVRRAYLGRSA